MLGLQCLALIVVNRFNAPVQPVRRENMEPKNSVSEHSVATSCLQEVSYARAVREELRCWKRLSNEDIGLLLSTVNSHNLLINECLMLLEMCW